MLLESLVKPIGIPESRAFIVRALALASATFADGYLTLRGIGQNISEEYNPVVNFYLETFGDNPGMVAVKAVPALFALATSAYAYKFGKSKLEQKLRNVPIYLGIIGYTLMACAWEFPQAIEKSIFWLENV